MYTDVERHKTRSACLPHVTNLGHLWKEYSERYLNDSCSTGSQSTQLFTASITSRVHTHESALAHLQVAFHLGLLSVNSSVAIGTKIEPTASEHVLLLVLSGNNTCLPFTPSLSF